MSEVDETMKALKKARAAKEFGSYFQASRFLELEGQMYKRATDKLAQQLVEAAVLNGEEPVAGSERLVHTEAGSGPLNNAETLGGSIRTVMSARPEQFICFAAFKIEEERQDAKSAKLEAEANHKRFYDLLDLVRTSQSMTDLRISVDKMLEE